MPGADSNDKRVARGGLLHMKFKQRLERNEGGGHRS